MAETISVRIHETDLEKLDQISKYEKASKSSVLREVLDLGIREKKLEIALKKFQNNEITAWKASRLAGVPLTEFLDLLKEKGLDFHYTEKEVEEEFEGLL